MKNEIEKRETVDMSSGSKEELFISNHSVVRIMREIDELIFEERQEEIITRGISLKKLFSRKQMDYFHVDCLVLYQIAFGVLHIMEELTKRHIFPGLYDLADFYADPGCFSRVWLIHPERFQLLSFEQDYEWYPEDERLFGDIRLFDEKAQKLADTRLLYKILTASSKGNVKIPPRMTEADYSELFYKALPGEWREIFGQDGGASHAEMKALLVECIEMEKEYAKKAKAGRKEEESEEPAHRDSPHALSGDRRPFYTLFVIMRTETENAGKISRFLYEEQDKLETESCLMGYFCHQAFVTGNATLVVKEFNAYPPGFRCQLEQKIREYSAGEAMLIGAELMKDVMDVYGESAGYRICLLTDGSLKNDCMFQCALERIHKLSEEGCEIRFIYEKESRCEACEKLKSLVCSAGGGFVRQSDADRNVHEDNFSGGGEP